MILKHWNTQKKLSAQLHVGIHPVTLDKSEFMEIYKKEPYLLQR